ncbi:MAG TPA: hypothetical protein PKB10_00595, partial [Tepidisphaeraceae bacterium]|nr:hypothetical protein [Tepidisphaeraceae bacterium]
MRIEVSNFQLELDLLASVHNQWVTLVLQRDGATLRGSVGGLSATITLTPDAQGLSYTLAFDSSFRTRLRLR